jgi:hypothetical protein
MDNEIPIMKAIFLLCKITNICQISPIAQSLSKQTHQSGKGTYPLVLTSKTSITKIKGTLFRQQIPNATSSTVPERIRCLPRKRSLEIEI